jgi:hypothetical protein
MQRFLQIAVLVSVPRLSDGTPPFLLLLLLLLLADEDWRR